MANRTAGLSCFLILAGLLAISMPLAAQDSGSGDDTTLLQMQLLSYVYGSELAPGGLAIAWQNQQVTPPQSQSGDSVSQPPTVFFTPEMQVEVEFRVDGRDPVRVETNFYSSISVYLVIPSDLPSGPIEAAFVIDGVIQEPEPFTLDPYAPALPSVMATSVALAQNYEGDHVALVGHTNPAIADHWVTLWLTGLNQAATSEVTVRIADQEVAADFAGASGIPGVDQINFRMPSHPYLGCYVPLEVDVAGYRSNRTLLATSDEEGDCNHPLGLSHEELATLDRFLQDDQLDNEDLPRVGAIMFSRSVGVLPDIGRTVIEGVYALLRPFALSNIVSDAGSQMPDSMRFGCTRLSPTLVGSGIAGGRIRVNPIEPGPLLLSGPSGQQIEVHARELGFGNYLSEYNLSVTNPDPPLLSPGLWSVSLPEGDGLASFQQSFRLPPAPTLLGDPSAPLSFTRDGENLIEWDSTVYQSSEMIQLWITAPAGAVQCTVRATDGRLSLPGDLLFGADGFYYVDQPSPRPPLIITVVPYPPDRTVFDIPLSDGGSSRGVFTYSLSGDSRDVTFQ